MLVLVLSAVFNTSGIHDLIHGHVLETQVPYKGLQEKPKACARARKEDFVFYNPLEQGNVLHILIMVTKSIKSQLALVAHLEHGEKSISSQFPTELL
jgi:hypothetical protein